MFKILTISLLLILASCGLRKPPTKIKIIKEIYACDRYAECAVKFEDGTVNQRVSRPIIGEKFECEYFSNGTFEICNLYKDNQ